MGKIVNHFCKQSWFSFPPILAGRGLWQFVELMSSLRDTICPNGIVLPETVAILNIFNDEYRGQKL